MRTTLTTLLAGALSAILLSGCALGSARTTTTAHSRPHRLARSPVALRPTPAWVREACAGLPDSIRTHCPRVFPAAAGRGLTLSVNLKSGGAPFNMLQVEAGGERAGDQHQNRPPDYVGLFIAGGSLKRALPTIFPKTAAPAVVAHDGSANMPHLTAVNLGRRYWGGLDGELSLTPSHGRIPLVYFHYLLFRWRDRNGETVVGLHAWEPLTQTVQTLHAIVGRLTALRSEPLAYPPDASTDGVAFTRSPRWLLDACRTLQTRPICPTRIPTAQAQITVFYEPRWRSRPSSTSRQDFLSISWGAPHGSSFAANHPPRFLHIDLVAGDVPVHRRFAHPAVKPHDGLMHLTGTGEAAGTSIPLGHPTWAGHHGILVLGDCFSNHLCYRWKQHQHTYQIDIHGWEPFTQTLATLHRIVAWTSPRIRKEQ